MGASHVVAACALVWACACGTADTRIDPGDLELRDLLGVSPETAGRWDVEQRESARRVLTDALADSGEVIAIPMGNGDTLDEQVARSLAALDAQRFAAGDSALGFVRVTIHGAALAGATQGAPTLRAYAEGKRGAPAIQLELTDTWRALPQESHRLLAALASDAGATVGDRIVVVPAPRLSVIASYVAGSPSRLLVNPVLLAAVDPHAETLTEVTPLAAASTASIGARHSKTEGRALGVLAAGNPYSFYGSIAECAYAQRSRCTACVAANDCVAITSSEGTAECNALDANGGVGYFLICVNLALAISSVDDCTAGLRPGCARDTDAASDLNQLQSNAVFLDDGGCGDGLDACLAKIYGEARNEFPDPGVDGGVDPVDPPRETNVTCNDSCDSDKSSNCELSPTCNCEGPSCGNSLSCDSTCSSSSNQSGCGDNCDSCSSDSTSSSGGGSCGGGSGSSSSSDCGGGSCGGGGCGGSSGGCGGDSGGCSSSSGGCQVAKKPPSAAFAMALSLSWALLPVPLAAMLRRRSRRRRKVDPKAAPADEEVTS